MPLSHCLLQVPQSLQPDHAILSEPLASVHFNVVLVVDVAVNVAVDVGAIVV